MSRISEHHDRIILCTKTQRTDPLNLHVHDCALPVRHDVQRFRAWVAVVGGGDLDEVEHCFLSDGIHEYVLWHYL